MKTTRRDDGCKPTPRRTGPLFAGVAAALGTLALLAAGCDDGHHGGHGYAEVVDTYAVVDYADGGYVVAPRTYGTAVQALTRYGEPVAGAEVTLIVSTAPEQVAYGYTGADGVAEFVFDAYPGVPVTADVNAYEWGSDFVTGYTDDYSDALVLQVVL